MSKRRRVARTKAALGWGITGFVAVQLVLDFAVVARCPEIHDPVFARRLTLLRARIAEHPSRPLLLLVGSSRTEMNFLPEALPPLRTAAGQEVLPFNFSHFMAGPVMNLSEVYRLLRHGIRPEWLVVEIMPPWLGDASQYILITTAGKDDFPLTRRYLKPFSMCYTFLSRQLVPCSQHRSFFARQLFPWCAPPSGEAGALGRLGGPVGWIVGPDADATLLGRCKEAARRDYSPRLQDLHVSEMSDRATHELLELCRQQGIKLVLLLTPEGSAFRSWYSARSRERIDSYCNALSRVYGVPLIDARTWLDDADFFDSHHVIGRGAVAFTRRLGREVLQPLVQGKLEAHSSKPTP